MHMQIMSKSFHTSSRLLAATAITVSYVTLTHRGLLNGNHPNLSPEEAVTFAMTCTWLLGGSFTALCLIPKFGEVREQASTGLSVIAAACAVTLAGLVADGTWWYQEDVPHVVVAAMGTVMVPVFAGLAATAGVTEPHFGRVVWEFLFPLSMGLGAYFALTEHPIFAALSVFLPLAILRLWDPPGPVHSETAMGI